ncbi:hypothetical protein [Streptomyces prunicolor]|uniref:hypothetical protein n=1 Tax=Streptomyces prunicolor TaxID=67348 RepID=UPI0033FEB2E1
MATPQSAGLPTTDPGRRPDHAGAADLDVLHVPQVTRSPQAPRIPNAPHDIPNAPHATESTAPHANKTLPHHTDRPGDRTTGPRTHAA